MKARFLLNLILLALVMSVVSCKEGKKGGRNLLPPVSGATNEILVVMNKALWDGPMGDTVKNFFQQPQLGLPQSEPMFDVINLPLANFEKIFPFFASAAPFLCLIFAHLLCPDIIFTSCCVKYSDNC